MYVHQFSLIIRYIVVCVRCVVEKRDRTHA